MLKILKSLNSLSEPHLKVDEEKTFTRFKTVKDIAELGAEKHLTRFQNERVRQQVEFTPAAKPKPKPMSQHEHTASEPKAQTKVVVVKEYHRPDVPISTDTLRSALPKRFASLNVDQTGSDFFTD